MFNWETPAHKAGRDNRTAFATSGLQQNQRPNMYSGTPQTQQAIQQSVQMLNPLGQVFKGQPQPQAQPQHQIATRRLDRVYAGPATFAGGFKPDWNRIPTTQEQIANSRRGYNPNYTTPILPPGWRDRNNKNRQVPPTTGPAIPPPTQANVSRATFQPLPFRA